MSDFPLNKYYMRAKRSFDKSLQEDATISPATKYQILHDFLQTNDSAAPGTGTLHLDSRSTGSFHAPAIDIHHSPGSSSQLSFNTFENNVNCHLDSYSTSSFHDPAIHIHPPSGSSSELTLNFSENNDNCQSRVEENPANSDNSSSPLAQWALQHNVPHSTLNHLLSILKESYSLDLPSDARTLLKTERSIVTKCVEPGHYYHFGLKNSILQLTKSFDVSNILNNTIYININVDGLPISKSSGSQVYPILCNIAGFKDIAMIGIYHGYQKPNDANSFLKDFVNEAIDLTNNRIAINGQLFIIKIKSFICDAPAKSFIKYTKGHTGYYSCTKCHIRGSSVASTTCFPDSDQIPLRTHIDFVLQIARKHHKGTSIIENIPGIDMINSFPLDYMHLICLGVVKKVILKLWCRGKTCTKLSKPVQLFY